MMAIFLVGVLLLAIALTVPAESSVECVPRTMDPTIHARTKDIRTNACKDARENNRRKETVEYYSDDRFNAQRCSRMTRLQLWRIGGAN